MNFLKKLFAKNSDDKPLYSTTHKGDFGKLMRDNRTIGEIKKSGDHKMLNKLEKLINE